MDRLRRLRRFLTSPETLLYLLFGVLTTAINTVVCGLCYDYLHWNILVANVLAWILAVAFAFLTNKLYVFQSKSFEASVLRREALGFTGARLFSLGVDEFGMWLLVDVLFQNVWAAKIAMNVLVVAINYVLSKFFIFRKK